MAKKKLKRAALKLATGQGRKPRTEIEQLHDARAEAQRLDWIANNPQAAGAERALRIRNIETRERWKHKRQGTAQTHEHVRTRREGALARLCLSGAIDAEQLAAGTEIAQAAELIMRDVDVRCASLEARVDISRGDGTFYEKLAIVRVEVAYSRWRSTLGPDAALVLSIVVEDLGITAAARRHRMGVATARRALIAGLDCWIRIHAAARKEIDPATLAAAQAAIL